MSAVEERPSAIETRKLTIERLLREFELCDVAGRLAIIEHAISQMRCTACPVCEMVFNVTPDYKVIPCLCRMHTHCLKRWLVETENTRPRACPGCGVLIEDDDSELWQVEYLRQKNARYHFGDETTAKKDDEDDDEDETDEDAPADFYPRARVPPQSPRRRTKARITKMRRTLTDGELGAYKKESSP